MDRLLRPLLGLLLALVVPLSAVAADGAAGRGAKEPPIPLLWKVTGQDKSHVYLLGSFHLLKPDDYPLAPEVDQAFEAAQRVVFELSPQDMESPQLASKLMAGAMRRDGKPLRETLDPALWARLQAYADSNGLPLAQMQVMRPWFVGLTISITEMTRSGLDPKLGLDRNFMERAQKAGKPGQGLETMDAQVQVFAGMSDAEQVQMLAEALDEAEAGSAQTQELHDLWRRGQNTVLLERMATEMRRDYPALYKRINTDRNDAWVPQLEKFLAPGQGDTLVVVGALHLLGPDGVVEKLRAKGYKVERICKRCDRSMRK